MNYVALKPVNFGGKQYKIGETIPEGVVDERRSLFLLYRKVRLWLLSKRKIAHIKVGRANR